MFDSDKIIARNVESLDKRTDQEIFFSKYNINIDEFKSCNITWNEIHKIYKDYLNLRPRLEPTANEIVNRLFKEPNVHSIRFRVKDEEHLIAKIIRKKNENPERVITIENYNTEITDLIGVRVLHLYKKDWKTIDEYIRTTWELVEKPIVYIREGDDRELFKNDDCRIKNHPNNYRSVHYLIKIMPTKEEQIAEIQVRTLFEEGWSEIDHDVRYPYDMDDLTLAKYLSIFNRIAGSADEMGSYIKDLKRNFNNLKVERIELDLKHKEEINKLKEKIEGMSIGITHKEEFKSDLDNLSLLDLFLPNSSGMIINEKLNSMSLPIISEINEEE